MLQSAALNNLEEMVATVVEEGVPGHFIEAGVWRGGASIYAAALIERWDLDQTRTVFVVDSFEGLPPASTTKDGNWWCTQEELRVSRDQVEESFQQYLPGRAASGRVVFVEGFVRHSMPPFNATGLAPGEDVAILRIDLDMYEGYLDVLFHLAPRVPAGGFFVMDDYHCAGEAKSAVDDFRRWHSIAAPLVDAAGGAAGGCAVWWRAERRLESLRLDEYAAFNAQRLPAEVAFSEAVDYSAAFMPALAAAAPNSAYQVAFVQLEGQSFEDALAAHCREAMNRLPPAFFASAGDCAATVGGPIRAAAEERARLMQPGRGVYDAREAAEKEAAPYQRVTG